MRTISAAVALLIGAGALLASFGGSGPVSATGSTQSSVSVYLNCPASITFALPAATGPCSGGNFTAIYSGVSQIVNTARGIVFYLSTATGGVKVTFSLTDQTTGKLLISGVGYGSMNSTSCSTPDLVVPASTNPTSNELNSGDTVKASFGIVFTGTGTPTFCSGGAKATLVSVGTTVAAGSGAVLDTTLTAGTPQQSTLSGFNGVSETYTNNGGSSLTVFVVGTVKNSAGSTIDLLSTSITLTSGGTTTAFLPFKQYPSGTYTVTVMAITTSNVAVSTPATVTVML